MATPEQPVATRPSSAATLDAAGQGTVAATHVAVTPTLVAAGVQARAIAAATEQIVESLAAFARQRQATIIPLLQSQLTETFAHRTPVEISKLLAKESIREREFLRRQAARIKRDLPKVLSEADVETRKAAMRKLMAREQRYMGQRERAMTARAHSLIESLDLQDSSPEGAMWLLGGPVHQHTAGCLAMANKFWPWPVLREVIHPPVHPGCPCRLIGLQEAVAAGLMAPDQIPDTQDALLRARRNAALEEALYATYPEWMIQDELLALTEANEPGHDPLGHRGESAPHPVLRYAKGLVKGGEFMPKIGGSSARTKVRRLVPHVRAPKGVAGRNLGRSVWMNGNHVHVPEARSFSRTIGKHHFTSPPGSTNVYRNGHLVSTPDQPSMHASTRRPRVGEERGKVTRDEQAPQKVLSAEETRTRAAGRRVEAAISTGSQEKLPVRIGQNAQEAHQALKLGGFTAEEHPQSDADTLGVHYTHPDGHDLTVTFDRRTSKVTAAAWAPGKPTKTGRLRRKLGLESPTKAEPSPKATPSPEKATQAPEKPHTPTEPKAPAKPKVDRLLGTGDPRWERQLDRADAGDHDAQWDLAAEADARGPNSDFAAKLKDAVGASKLRSWRNGSKWPGAVPKGDAPPRYEVAHVDASQHGPAVGVALHDDVAGGIGDVGRPLGTGRYFTSGRNGEDGSGGLSLAGAHLHRPADAEASRTLGHGLSILNTIADGTGNTAVMPDPTTAEPRQFGIDDVLDRLPDGVDRGDAGFHAEHAIDMHRAPDATEAASTHLMRGLGYDGVDNRHLPELDVPEAGSVVYAPQGVESHVHDEEQSAPASPAQGGAVVRGVMGRWVWIRGRYTHIPQDAEWTHTEDGITFWSPAGGTGVYRKQGDAQRELVSAPGMRARHPDVRNPSSGGTRRGTGNGPSPSPTPEPTPGDPLPGDNPDGGVIPEPEPTPEPIPAAPDGVGMVMTQAGRDALLAGERVAGVQHSDTQFEPINATGLPEGVLVTGSPWARMTGEERQVALDTAYGRALAHAIGSETSSREEMGGLWTGGKFTDDQGVHLDRYDAANGLAAAYAQMGGEGWRAFAARYPDVARFVSQQAEARNYHVRPDVADWLHSPDTGNVHDPVGVLTGDARELADSLNGMTTYSAGLRLRAEGWTLHSRNGNAEVWRKVDTEGKQVHTLSFGRGENGLVAGADGTSYGFNPTQVPPEGNTPERLAWELRAMTGSAAQDHLRGAGWFNVNSVYGGGGGTTQMWVNPDTNVALRVGLRNEFSGSVGSAHQRAMVEDARPTMLDPSEHELRLRTITRSDPSKGIPEGTLIDDVTGIVNGSGWTLGESQQPDGDHLWHDIEKTADSTDPNNATYDAWRVQYAKDADGNWFVSRVGRPGNDAGSIAPDDAAWRNVQAGRQANLRQAATERLTRIEGLKERIRTSMNAGNAPQLQRADADEVRVALTQLGYRPGSVRTLQSGAESTTWQDAQFGGRLSVRTQNGAIHSVRFLTRGQPNEGRVRTPEGQMPSNLGKMQADLKGLSDELAEEFGARSDITGITFTARGQRGSLSDHTGVHGWDGQVKLGSEVGPSIEAVIRARAEGHPLTDVEKSSAIHAYRTMAHEIIHGVGQGLRGSDYQATDGGQGIEESLTEELTRGVANDLMRRHGLGELLQYARDNPGRGDKLGAYQRHRQAFGSLLADMGLDDESQAGLLNHFQVWKFTMTPDERREDFATRISDHRGSSLTSARERVSSAMRGNNSTGSSSVTGFTRILQQPIPDPIGSDVSRPFGGGDRVQWGEDSGYDPGSGIVIGASPRSAGGWWITVRSDNGQTIDFRDAELRSAGAAPTGPTLPIGTTVPTASLRDGGKVGEGARVIGAVSGLLATVTSVNGDQITVRRDNGTTATFDGGSFKSIAITNTGEAIPVGDTAWTPGEAGQPAWQGALVSVDWSDPLNPQATLFTNTGPRVVPARTLTTADPANGAGWQLPMTRRDGTASFATAGTQVQTSAGETVTLMGQSISSWPTGTLMYTATRADGSTLSMPREGIVGFAGELPRPPTVTPDERDAIQRLRQAHFDREDGSHVAGALGAWIGRTAGPGFEQYLTANGVALNDRSGESIIRAVYAGAFKSKADHDAIKEAAPIEYAGVMTMAREAGLPTPDWDTQRPLTGGEPIPDGDMTSEPVLRALYTGTFGNAGHTTVVESVLPTSGGASISGVVKDSFGSQVGTFSRRITRNPDGSFAVYNAYLQLNSSAQGTGFASAFNRHCFDAYRQRGVREVTVTANIDIGGYTWAATGFDFNVGGTTEATKAEGRARQATAMAENALRNGSITREQYDTILPKLWDGRGPLTSLHVQHAWELAHIDGQPSGRGRTRNIGQRIMLGTHWSGIRLLDRPDPDVHGGAAPTPRPTPTPRTRRASVATRAREAALTQRLSAAAGRVRMNTPTIHTRRRRPVEGRPLPLDHQETVADFDELTQRLHPGLQVPEVMVSISPLGPRTDGAYYRSLRQIMFATRREGLARRDATYAHEYGHHIDDQLLQELRPSNPGYQELQDVYTAIGQTPMRSRIRDAVVNRRVGRTWANYALQRNELWARAYAEYAAQRAGYDRLIEQTEGMRRGIGGIAQWESREEFEPVAVAIDRLFAALGAARPQTTTA